MSLLAQALLYLLHTADGDLGRYISVATNEKFTSVFVTASAFRKSDVPGHHIGKSGCTYWRTVMQK